MLRSGSNERDIFGELYGVLGEEAMLALLQDHAGIRIYIPFAATLRSPLCRSIGLPALQKLVKAFAGERMSIPLAKSFRIRILRKQGKSYTFIARAVGTTIPTVHKALKDAGMTNTTPRRKRVAASKPVTT